MLQECQSMKLEGVLLKIGKLAIPALDEISLCIGLFAFWPIARYNSQYCSNN